MSIKDKKILLIIIFSFCFGNFLFVQKVLAAPSVTNVSGTISNGSSVTVSGSGFGSKSNPAPTKFDNFENGTNGLELRGIDPAWKLYYTDPGVFGTSYFDTQSHSGAMSVGVHVTDGEFFHTNFFTTPPSDEMYISYWYQVDTTGPGAYSNYLNDHTVIKLARINSSEAAGGGGIYTGVGDTTLGGTYDLSRNSGPYCAYHNGQTYESFFDSNIAGLNFPPVNQWLRVDMYKKLSTPGVNDGVAEIKIYGLDPSGYSAYNGAALTRAAGQAFQLDTVMLGLEDGSSGAHNYYMYLDDFYINNTRARVEVCDSSTWAARMHCEIQIPQTQWTDGQLQFKVNQGSFANNSTAYLYVVDENGNPSSDYPITFSSVASSKTYSISDFTTLISHWFHGDLTSDFNSDNIVNAKDLGIMMSKWN